MEAFSEDQDKALILRQEMVKRLKTLDVLHMPVVEDAFLTVPRHLFVPGVELKIAYSDIPIATRLQDGHPISSSSAPSVMAIMLEMLDLRPGQCVLEIGAGTGYNAALMARIVGEDGQIVTVDLDEDIVQDARAHLQTAGVENVRVICGDGALGYAAGAPYDHVILTASAADIPPAWREQLRPGGRLVVPFQTLAFRSKLAEPPLLPDQFLLAFTWTGIYFESIDMRPCGFMALRGDFAQKIHLTSNLQPEAGISALLPADIDASSLSALLAGSVAEEATSIHLSFQEIYGLRLWLALRDPQFCEVYVPEGTPPGAIPAQLRRTQTFAAAIGLCAAGTLCLLLLQEEEHGWPADPRRPFKLALRRFGPNLALSECLREDATAWEQAGHPFVWRLDGRMQDMQIRAYPVETPYAPQPYETVLTRRSTRFIFTPQIALASNASEFIPTEPG